MRRLFLIFAVFALCVATFEATAQVTKGLHFYLPFNEGKGDVAKDVGPKGFEAELHDSAKFVAKYDRALTAEEVKTVMNARDILTVDIAGKLTTTWGALKTK